ncbi:SDR family oxidoreductase [Phaeocystidibacter marisrubri]|nr:SDR family oxidoreductase [Phaeocystidibacter marisrubri]
MSHTTPMLPEGSLKDSVILVTGGGSGLGKSMSTYFSQLGAKVVIASRKQERLDEAAKEISDLSGNEVFPIACDVRSIDDVESMLDKIEAKWELPHVVVNNAAGNFISPTERLSANAFDAIIDIVLKGTKNVTLATGKRWISKGLKDRNFLNIVTTYAWTGSAYVVPSAMSKAGVLAMTRSLAIEWAKYGIRSNAIAPGPFPTEGAWSRLLPGDTSEKLNVINQIPLRRSGEHQELNNLAAYMISPFAAYMNGEVVTLDGGEWLQDAGQLNFLDQVTEAEWDMLAAMTKRAK